MKNEDGRILERLAEAITDETEIDWDAEQAAHPELSSRLERLRLIEQIAEVHRTPPDGETAIDEPVLFSWGHLRVLEELGQGSFGAVFRAYDPQLQREVALKLLRPDRADRPVDTTRFLAEARRMARVRHPGVLTIHGVDEHDGRPGFWTDLVDGETLEQRLDREGPLGAGEAAAGGLELCRALAAVHQAGVVHGDIKATNVMRDDRGRIVLMDFGAGSEPQPRATPGKGTILGTPMILAPELFDGVAPSTASDLYALGVLLYRLVTGRYPVTAESVEELRRKLKAGERIPLLDRRPDLPVAFAEVVDRALAPDPTDRHRSAGDMASALANSLRAGTMDPGTHPARWRHFRRWVLSAVAALAVLIGILLLRPDETPTISAERGTPTGPPAVMVTPLTVEATLYRSLGGAREALPAGALVRPGDTLYLEYHGSRPAHVYVLNEDGQGDVFLLFPLPGQDLANPLPANLWHRLPGPHDGVLQDWQVTGGQGQEAFLVVAAVGAVDWLEELIAGFSPASPDRPVRSARLDPTGLIGTRGVKSIVPADSVGKDPNASTLLAGIARRLTESAAEPGGLWIRQFVVYNSGI
jgi:serine/threonine protein kinase